MDECDHIYVRTGEQHRVSPMRDSWQYWDAYFCQKCLKHQYVLVKSSNGYSGEMKYHDGSKRADRLETHG